MSELRDLVAEELAMPVDPRVAAFARVIAAKHGEASRAVLFYGSCLRQQQLDVLMLDFYLIVSDYRTAYAKRWLAVANRMIPPNVFYAEHDGLVAKYAVLSEGDFERECGPDAFTVSTAARFAQPSRVVWSSDAATANRMIDVIAKAAPTVLGWAYHVSPSDDASTVWKTAFGLTFGAELRAERLSRSGSLVDADPERYRTFGVAALRELSAAANAASTARWWRKMQRRGKWYSIARLAKASFTFAGGAEYIVWKVNRHTGADIQLKPWQRRHPLLAGLTLLPRLLRSGAVR